MKYLDLSLDQIAEFLKLYKNSNRETMLLEQKRRLEKKREQLNTVIAHVDRAIQECRGEELDAGAGWGNLWRCNQEQIPEQFRNAQGQFTFERDTYLYRCRKEK